MNKNNAEYDFLDDDFKLTENKCVINLEKEKKEYKIFNCLKQIIKSKKIIISFIILIIIIVLAFAYPLISTYKYNDINLENKNLSPRIPKIEKFGIFNGKKEIVNTESNTYLDKENIYYWFGSDSLGRDIWSRTWEGTKVSLYIALIAVIVDIIFGITFGLLSGYIGGKFDMIMQRIVEIINSIPTLVVVTLILIIIKPGLSTITMTLMITGWIGMNRFARALMLKEKNKEYVQVYTVFGINKIKIIFKEILPNLFGQLMTNMVFSISNAIFIESFLSFIGLGISAPDVSLGSLISDGYKTLTIHPYQIVPPIVVLVLILICLNILTDGLRDIFEI